MILPDNDEERVFEILRRVDYDTAYRAWYDVWYEHYNLPTNELIKIIDDALKCVGWTRDAMHDYQNRYIIKSKNLK